MKKSLLFLAIMLTAFSTVNAQDYNKGDWELGPIIGIGGNFNFKDEFGFNIDLDAGLYGEYAFTDIVKGVLETKYEFRWGIGDGNWHYLNVPALVCFQIGTGYIGAGAQYSFCLAPPKESYSVSNGNLSYPSAFLEFSYITHWSTSGHYTVYSEQGFRAILRIGYALTPISYGIYDDFNQSYKTFKYSPLFIESVLRFDIGKYFANNKVKTNRRRR